MVNTFINNLKQYVKEKNYEIYQKKIDLTELNFNKVWRFLHTKKYSGGASIHRIDKSFLLKPSLGNDSKDLT